MSIYILGMAGIVPGGIGWDEKTIDEKRAQMREMENQLACFGYSALNPAKLPVEMLGTAGLLARAAMIQAASACISVYPGSTHRLTIDGAIAEYLRKPIYHPEDIYTKEGVLRQNSPKVGIPTGDSKSPYRATATVESKGFERGAAEIIEEDKTRG